MNGKIKCVLITILCFILHNSKAQFVTIADPAFVNFLNLTGLSPCLSGNHLDTTCSLLPMVTTMNCYNRSILNLDGIEYFKNLRTLNCGANLFQTSPLFPNSLRELYCKNNINTVNIGILPDSLLILSLDSTALTFINMPVSLPQGLQELNISYCNQYFLPPLPLTIKIFTCRYNNLDSLPVLNDSVTTLLCNNNNLVRLPALPGTLKILECQNNYIDSLPSLPDSLIKFNCNSNRILYLPLLPATLEYLNFGSCNNSPIDSLPLLPAKLKYLNCERIFNNKLPVFTDSLIEIYCRENNLATILSLPAGLRILNCVSNQLVGLPALPATLKELWCGDNFMSSIPSFPSGLKKLHCEINHFIPSMPTLPDSLIELDCSFNSITSLPNFPNSIIYIDCSDNQLTSLPAMPNSITNFDCSNNQIISIDSISKGIVNFNCSSNQLNFLSDLPDSMNTLYISYNPSLHCLPHFKVITDYMEWNNTGITCMPNLITAASIYPSLTSVPLCGLINTYHCPPYRNISGQVYQELNNNCAIDSAEEGLKNIRINLYKNGIVDQTTFTNDSGRYSFYADTGIYNVAIINSYPEMMFVCPSSGYLPVTVTPSVQYIDSINLGATCGTGFDIGAISLLRDSGQFRPARYAYVNIDAGDITHHLYNLKCDSLLGGIVQVIINGPANYVGPITGALIPAVNGDTIIYSIADYSLLKFNDLHFIVQTNSNAFIGSQVCFDIAVFPIAGDSIPANNLYTHCFNVVNSFDPNDKEVSPPGAFDINKYWFTYTIRFQNTGNAPALDIYIDDTLDNNLNENSFQLLSYSHEPVVEMKGKVLRFNFPGINLPDSTTDEPHSHGYLQYIVKRKNTLPLGTKIRNKAFIYFDLNPAIITNTTVNTLTLPSAINGNQINNSVFTVYPNPAKPNHTLNCYYYSSAGNARLIIYDVSGRVVYSVKVTSSLQIQQIRLPDISEGMYQCVAENKNGITRQKLVVVQ